MVKMFSSMMKCAAVAREDTLAIAAEKSLNSLSPCFARATRYSDMVVFKNTALREAANRKREFQGSRAATAIVVDSSNFTFYDVLRSVHGLPDIAVGVLKLP